MSYLLEHLMWHSWHSRKSFSSGNCHDVCALLPMLPLLRTFRDEWQRQHEPLDTDYRGSSSSSGPSRPSLPQRRRLHAIPDSLAPRDPMTAEAYKAAVVEAASDKMAYSFVRYLMHCLQVSASS